MNVPYRELIVKTADIPSRAEWDEYSDGLPLSPRYRPWASITPRAPPPTTQ